MPERRTVLVTGASSGIGLAVCEHLLDDGHAVIGVARDFSKCSVEHSDFHTVTVDLADLDALPERLGGLAHDYPAIDALICNAGRGQFGSLEEFSCPQIGSLIDLNLTSQVFVTRMFLPAFKRRGRGDVIFIGSEAALTGGRKGAVYCATKFALRGLAQALREECAKSGVRVSIVNPGAVDTPFFDALDFRPGDDPDSHIQAKDIAGAVGFVLGARMGTVFDEINVSPLKKTLRFDKR